MTPAHETVGDRLQAADLADDRYIKVEDGEKRTYDHDTRYSDPADVPGRNYGVYADDGRLVVLDIDDHDGGADGVSAAGVAALGALPATLETASPHGGTHRFYKLADAGDAGDVLQTRLGTANPVPSWGEVQASSKYVVGAGSRLSGCDKEWCDRCAEPDGGTYEVGADRPVAEIDAETLVDALAADPELSDRENQNTLDETAGGDAGGAGDYDGEGYDADVETVRDALACVSPDLGYNEWRNVGFAVCDALDAGDGVEARTTAREVYVAWSRGDYHPDLADDATASAWDSEARSRAEAVIDGWEPPSDGDVTAGTLWSYALDADHGPAEWSPPSDWGGDPSEESVKEKVARYSDEFDDPSEVPDDVVPSVGVTDEGGDDDGDASVTATSPGGELEHSSEWHDEPMVDGVTPGYGYVFEKSRPADDEPPLEWVQVSNWTLKTEAVISVDGEERLRLRVEPATDESAFSVEVHPTVFNETRAFKEEVVRGRTTTFENVNGDALADLRLTAGLQDCPRHGGVAHVGAAKPSHDDDDLPADAWNEWVTPDGVLTADGWADDAEASHTYVARSQSQTGDESIVGEKWTLTPSDDEIDREEVAEICRRLPNARLPDRALPTLAWFYVAPLRPLVYHAEEQFPHLSVRGKTESGKTAWLSMLSEALGMDETPFTADATTFSLEMMHVGSRGAPVWIDEYKPSQMKPGRKDKLHTFMREATREAVHTKGRPDQSFVSYRMQAPVCVSGEQTIKEPAVARRSMQVQLSARATDMETTQRAYAELAGEAVEIDGETQVAEGFDLSQHALAYYRWLLAHDAETLVERWHDCRDETGQLLDAVDADMSGTERQAVQTVVFGWRLFRSFAETYGVETTELPGRDALEKAVAHVCGNVGKNGRRREHGDELLELASQAAAAGYLEPDDPEHGDTPYRVYEPQAAEGDAVALHLPSVYPEVRRFVRDYGLESEYNLLSKTDYTDEFGDVEGSNSHILGVSKKVRNVKNGKRKRCLVVDAERCRRRLGEDWLASAFGAEVDVGDSDSEVDSDGDGDDGGAPASEPTDAGAEADVSPAQTDDERLAPGDVTTDTPNARGRVPAVEATVTAAWEDRYGTPTVSLGDGSGTLTAAVVGRDRPELRERARVVVSAAQATTDDLGTLSLEIDPTTEVTVVSTPKGDGDSEAVNTAAADGGKAAGDSDGDDDSDDGETADDGQRRAAVDGDPERPHGPHDDVQCRSCGAHWLAGSKDGSPLRDCPQCDGKIDWDWNVDTGRVPDTAAPDDTEYETVRGRVVEWLRDDPDPVTVTRATVDLGVDADDARDALDALVEDGRLMDTETEGRYEVNR